MVLVDLYERVFTPKGIVIYRLGTTALDCVKLTVIAY